MCLGQSDGAHGAEMRIGLIADIHGNLVALDAVLTDMADRAVDRVVCLGDVAVFGPEPAGVIGRLREIGCPSVAGNTDAWLLGPDAAEPSLSDEAVGRALTEWTRQQLGPDAMAWLRDCPSTLSVDLGAAGTLLCGHGSPRSHEDVIAATTPDDKLESMFAGDPCDAFAGGHTHIRLLRQTGDRTLVNPGSVGLPGVGPGTPDLAVNRNVSWAEYAILDTADELVSVAFHRLPLDLVRVVAAGWAGGMPHLDWWVGRWAVESNSRSPLR